MVSENRAIWGTSISEMYCPEGSSQVKVVKGLFWTLRLLVLLLGRRG
jgi:hypothetical protein